ncbi:sensor histidine kinase [Chitinimonas sp.]|uniref:sensor histidine kinase n=1 Tax=Chitinimonas sp. TaxID=1934313 RepID=UPI0035B216D8
MSDTDPPAFFPRDARLWLLHGCGMLLIVVTQLLSAWMWGSSLRNDALATLIWVLPYTGCVLGFRYLYLRNGWERLELWRVALLSLLYGTLAGLLIAACVFIATLPLVWPGIVASHAQLPGWKPLHHALRLIVGNGLSNQLFVCAWIFIFVSAMANQRARQAELSNLRLQNSLKEAQLSTLASQLNPHFLFNALNNIRFLFQENGRAADGMMTSLSELLRYSLESSRRDKVSLSEELAMVERFIAIMKIQMENRLELTLDVPDALRNCLIPPMVLQLLVENAIKHGLEQLPAGGVLALLVSERDGRLKLFVGNDAPEAPASESPSTGIGLQNIERRLALLYGKAAQMLVTRDTRQFEVELLLPKELAR